MFIPLHRFTSFLSSEVQMRHRTSKFLAAAAAAAGAVVSAASVMAATPTGLIVQPRVFNDFPNSNLSVTVDANAPIDASTRTPAGDISINGLNHTVEIHDANIVRDGGGGANRTDLVIAANNAGAFTGNLNTPFTISATINLTAGTNGPRKEAGLRINAPVTGDALFIINSDAGEIVAFGGGASFFLFGKNANGNGYTPGTPITLTETYTPGPGGTTQANPGTLTYSAQLEGGPLMTSGPLAWANNEGGPGPDAFTIGIYEQGGGSSPIDFADLTISNISAVVPEPASLGLLGVGAFSLLTRRRARKI